jgi:diacylglycerol O-acyltransferase / wax synthase
MQNHNHDRLSRTDAIFLYLEHEGMPMNIAGVSELEGIVSYEECVRLVESKIPLIPRYRQRAVAPLLNIGRPLWEFDPNFNVRNHVHEVKLKRGTHSEFKALAGKILSKVMDRQRPLWDITLVRGLKGDRTGLITRVHHCLADGISGVGLMNVIMSDKPEPAPPGRKSHKFRVPPPRDPLAAVVEDLASTYSSAIELVLATQANVLRFAEKIVSGNGTPAGNGSAQINGSLPTGERTQLLLEMATPTEALHFNKTVYGPEHVAWIEVPLADIKAVKEACKCSVNDVALAVVTAAIRRYVLLHGEDIKRRLLRIMVPVNIRQDGSKGELGNQISIVAVTIPLNIEKPRKLLEAMHQRTEFLKKTSVAELATLAGALIGLVPPTLQAAVLPIAAQLPITPFNLVCTNVPGPQYPLYLMEHKMLNWYPYVPIGGDMALNVAVLSYNGSVYFGFSGDVNVVPDIERLETFLASSMRELQRAARPHSRKKSVPAKTKRTRATTEIIAPAAPVASVTTPSPEAALEEKPEEKEVSAAAVA